MAVEQNEIKTVFTIDISGALRDIEKVKKEAAKIPSQPQNSTEAVAALRKRLEEERLALLRSGYTQNTSYSPTKSRDTQLSPQVLQAREQQEKLQAAIVGTATVLAGAFVSAVGAASTALTYSVVKASQYEEQMRELKGQATESGAAFETIRQKNVEIAAQFGVSQIRAASLTNSLTELLGTTKQLGRMSEVSKSIADIAAVRGMSLERVAGILKSINDGFAYSARQLGVSDINKQLRDYARSINVSVAELTEAERAQVALNAVMEKGKGVVGESDLALQTLEGTKKNFLASLDDMATSIGRIVTESGIIQEFIKTTSALFKELTLDVDNLNKKLSEGQDPMKVAREAYSKPGFGDYAQAGATALAGLTGLPQLFFGFDVVAQAVNPFAVYERNLSEFAARVKKQQELIERQKAQAEKQGLANRQREQEEVRERQERKDIQSFLRKSSREISNQKTTIAALEALRDEATKKLQGLEYAERLEQFNEQISQAIERSVESGKRKVEDLGRSWKSVFDNISRSQAAGNPIAQVFLESNEAVKKLKEEMKGLPKQIQDIALQSQRELNSNRLFEANINQSEQILELKKFAEDFSDYSRKNRELAKENLQREVAEFNRKLLVGVNSNVDANIEYFNLRMRSINRELKGEERKEFLKTQFEKEAQEIMSMSGVNNQARLEELRRRFHFDVKNVSTEDQRSLDEKIRSLRNLIPENEAQRAALEDNILRFARSLNPDNLTVGQRTYISNLANSVAERMSRQAQEAHQFLKKQTELQTKIEDHQKKLLELAKRGGIHAIEALITVKDETDSGVTVRRPTTKDVERAYNPDLLIGSGSGLINR